MNAAVRHTAAIRPAPVSEETSLGDFLRTRRAALQPEDVGLALYGGRRRVPGLRREELAQLAGVSAAYYTRLEQGQSVRASDEVLDALARVLQLDEAERAHLQTLARPARRTAVRAPRPETLRPSIRHLVAAMSEVPVLVLGLRADVLLWNPLGHAMFFGHLDAGAAERPSQRPNMIRMVFLDPHMRELYVDWRRKARDAVAYLRLIAGQYPNDPQLGTLVGELTMKSPEFATLWAAHPVKDCEFTTRDYHHPLVGRLTLYEEVLRVPDNPGIRLGISTPVPGSPSQQALRLLAQQTTRVPTP